MGPLGEFDAEVVGSVGCGLVGLYIPGVLTGSHLLFLGISQSWEEQFPQDQGSHCHSIEIVENKKI